MKNEMSIGFRVRDSGGQPADPRALDQRLDEILDSLTATAGDDITDIDIDAVLSRGEVTFTMSIIAEDETTARGPVRTSRPGRRVPVEWSRPPNRPRERVE